MDTLDTLLARTLGDVRAAAAVLARARADGVTGVSTAALVREDEWVAYGVPRIQARALLVALKTESRPAAPAPSSLLPEVPDDESLLQALRVGGVAKVQPTDVVAALRVAFAQRLGVLQAEQRLLAAIEQRARGLDEPCPQVFYDLQRSRARREHASVLAALDIPGTFVTERRKQELLKRLSRLWDLLPGFQARLEQWQATWQQRVTNPGALLAGIAAMVHGGPDAAPALGMMEAPDSEGMVDAARGVIDAVNRVFAGPGIPVARALAADAVELRALLARPDLAEAVGAGSREELLKSLGLAVSADLVRAEKAVVQYVLGVLRLPDVDPPQRPMVLVALKELGATVRWELLRSPPRPAAAPRGFGA